MRKHVGMTLVLLWVCLAFLVSGCAFLQRPEGRIITEIVAQDVGYVIAREDPELAARILEYMETGPDSVSWRAWVIARLVDDEFLRMNFEKLASLIEVDLEGVGDIEERMGIVAPVLRSFAEGIRIGLRESKKPVGHLSLAEFTWEGELDPNDFGSWRLLSVRPVPQGYFWVFVENPDRASAIGVVVLEVDLESSVLGYRYFKDGEPYLYVFDIGKDRYVRYRFTREERESCAECHGGEPERDLLHEDMKGA